MEEVETNPVFIFTRHAESCNNIISSDFKKSSDPSLTDYGIKSSIDMGDKFGWNYGEGNRLFEVFNPTGGRRSRRYRGGENFTRNLQISNKRNKESPLTPAVDFFGQEDVGINIIPEQNVSGSPLAVSEEIKVYVSCLLRTWETAVLLYRHHTTIKLVLSPFLKEYDKGFYDMGNLPETFQNQAASFLQFLEKVKERIDCQKINICLQDHTLVSFLINAPEKHAPIVKEVKKVLFIPSFRYPSEFFQYYPEGLKNFVEWYKRSVPEVEWYFPVNNTKVRESFPLVMVVCHSHLMRDYFTVTLNLEKKKIYENLWSILLNGEANREQTSLLKGIVPESQRKPFLENSLCAQDRAISTRVLSLKQSAVPSWLAPKTKQTNPIQGSQKQQPQQTVPVTPKKSWFKRWFWGGRKTKKYKRKLNARHERKIA